MSSKEISVPIAHRIVNLTLYSVLFLISITSCTTNQLDKLVINKSSDGYLISGKFVRDISDNSQIEIVNSLDSVLNTGEIKDNTFTLKGKIEDPQFV